MLYTLTPTARRRYVSARCKRVTRKEGEPMKELQLDIEELEERVAPSLIGVNPPGQLGNGQPGPPPGQLGQGQPGPPPGHRG